jgi:hypothetical protein
MTFEADSEFLYIKKGGEMNEGLDMKNGKTFEAESEYLYQLKIEELQAELTEAKEIVESNYFRAKSERERADFYKSQRDKLAEGLREIENKFFVRSSSDALEVVYLARQTLKDAGVE